MHGLMAARREVNDGEARMAKPDVAPRQSVELAPSVIGSAMR